VEINREINGGLVRTQRETSFCELATSLILNCGYRCSQKMPQLQALLLNLGELRIGRTPRHPGSPVDDNKCEQTRGRHSETEDFTLANAAQASSPTHLHASNKMAMAPTSSTPLSPHGIAELGPSGFRISSDRTARFRPSSVAPLADRRKRVDQGGADLSIDSNVCVTNRNQSDLRFDSFRARTAIFINRSDHNSSSHMRTELIQSRNAKEAAAVNSSLTQTAIVRNRDSVRVILHLSRIECLRARFPSGQAISASGCTH
jgi:hypothetical protein